MKIVHRLIVWSISFSLIVFIVFSLLFFMVFPVTDVSEIIEAKFLDLPFLFFAPSMLVAIGVIFGLILSFFWKKQIETIDQALTDLSSGRQLTKERIVQSEDIAHIWPTLETLQTTIAQQVKATQKLVNEKAVETETQIQAIVSQERNRLARELHDSVSQQLFAASMLMSAVNETETTRSSSDKKQLQLVEEMIHQSQLEMRALLLHLRPIPLKGKTLQEGMTELLVELSQKVPFKITWKIETFSLEKGVEDHLFRILQESISNTLRHSKASMLEVLLIQRDELVIMRVTDDGVGFNVEKMKAGSYGMQNMYERANEIGGTLKVVSLEQQGTRLEVKVPLMVGENID